MAGKDFKITADVQLPSLDYSYTKKIGGPEAVEESPPTYGFQEATGMGNNLVLLKETRWYR